MFPIQDSVPRRFPPFVVWTLIAINVAVFWYERSLPQPALEALVMHYGLVPARYTDPAWALANGLDPGGWLPLLTTMFLHGGWAHLIANMWTLWLFGAAVEDRLGVVNFLVLYLVAGLGADLLHLLLNPHATIPAIGASGAIAGVLGAYAVMFPLARVVVVVPVLFLPLFFELPAMLFAAAWFLVQFLQGAGALLAPQVGGGVAWWAHVGGFVTGMLLVPWLRRPERMRYYRDEAFLGHGAAGGV